MSTKEQLQCINKTIELTNNRKEKVDTIYDYISNQLDYIKACILDQNVDRTKLRDVNIGALAVREFYDDIEYSDLLKRTYFIVYYIQDGKPVPKTDEKGNIIV